MRKMCCRQGYNIRFGDHAHQYSCLRKHDMSQILAAGHITRSSQKKKSRAHHFLEHVHDEFQWNIFLQLHGIFQERR
jgi:hypothetical protein